MAKAMSPSDKLITRGQVGKFYDVLASALVKSGFRSDRAQLVLQTQGAALAEEFVASVRKRIELFNNMLVRRVKDVDRSRLPRKALEATGCQLYGDDDAVVATMPHGTGKNREVIFLKLGYSVSDDNLEAALAELLRLLGFKPDEWEIADPYTQGRINEDDPSFAGTHPNGTHWKDADGKWCFAAFDEWGGERNVNVHRVGHVWYGSWWFPVVRKLGRSLSSGSSGLV